MKVLFVDACPRREESRTLALAQHFVSQLRALQPELSLTVHCLPEMGLTGINRDTLQRKEALCDARCWSDPLLHAGRDLSEADAAVIAAPYWDLMFPSILKVWIEHIWVRNLTFVYRNDKPVGLLRAKYAVFLTTAGSRLQWHDWGTLYLEDVLKTLGVPRFYRIAAEGLDLEGADPGALLGKAMAEAEALASALCIEGI